TDGDGSHGSTSKTPSYTKSVSWHHYHIMVIEYWLSNNAGGSVTANGIAGKVTIRQLAIFKNYIKCRSIWFLGVSLD
ncbi:hypothetical protein, partial [Escherichia coli]